MYCNIKRAGSWELYRNTVGCIVTRGARGKARLCSNTTQPSHDMAARLGAEAPATRPSRPTTRPSAPATWLYVRMPGRACAHLGVLAGSASCAHCALVQFLDTLLLLSHCLNTVHKKTF